MKMFNPQIQQQQPQQQQGGLLSSLFGLLGAAAPHIGGPAGMIATMGKAITNPNAQNLSGAIGQMAEMVGDNNSDGKPDVAQSGNQTPFQQPGFVGPTQESALENPGGGQVNDSTTTPVEQNSQEGEQSQQPSETDVYAGMTVRDMFQKFPGLEGMFPTMLAQLQRNGMG
jgi:hypothetical protein